MCNYALKTVFIEGVPQFAPPTFELAAHTFKDYPTFCGAGKGWGDKLVSDCLIFLKVSPACHIHDKCFEWMDGVAGFVFSNIIFLGNMLLIVWFRSCLFLRPFRATQAIIYFMMVTTFGRCIYAKKKGYILLSLIEISIVLGAGFTACEIVGAL